MKKSIFLILVILLSISASFATDTPGASIVAVKEHTRAAEQALLQRDVRNAALYAQALANLVMTGSVKEAKELPQYGGHNLQPIISHARVIMTHRVASPEERIILHRALDALAVMQLWYNSNNSIGVSCNIEELMISLSGIKGVGEQHRRAALRYFNKTITSSQSVLLKQLFDQVENKDRRGSYEKSTYSGTVYLWAMDPFVNDINLYRSFDWIQTIIVQGQDPIDAHRQKTKLEIIGILEKKGEKLFAVWELGRIRRAHGLDALSGEIAKLADRLCSPLYEPTEPQLGAITAALTQLNSQESTQGLLAKHLGKIDEGKLHYQHLGGTFEAVLNAIAAKRLQVELFEGTIKREVLGLLEKKGEKLFGFQLRWHLSDIRDAQGLRSLIREVAWLANDLCNPEMDATEQQLDAITAVLKLLNDQESTQGALITRLGEKNERGELYCPHLGGSFDAALAVIAGGKEAARRREVQSFKEKIKPVVLGLLQGSFSKLQLDRIQKAQDLDSLTREVIWLANDLCSPEEDATGQQLDDITAILRHLNSQELTQGVLAKHIGIKNEGGLFYPHLGGSFDTALKAIGQRRPQVKLFEEKNKPAVLGLLEGKNLFSEQYLVHIRDAQGLNSLTARIVTLANDLCSPEEDATGQQLDAIAATLKWLNAQEPAQGALAACLGRKHSGDKLYYQHLGGGFPQALVAIDQRRRQVQSFEEEIRPGFLNLLQGSFNPLRLVSFGKTQGLDSLTREVVWLANGLCDPVKDATGQQLGAITAALNQLNSQQSTRGLLAKHLGTKNSYWMFYNRRLGSSFTEALAAIDHRRRQVELFSIIKPEVLCLLEESFFKSQLVGIEKALDLNSLINGIVWLANGLCDPVKDATGQQLDIIADVLKQLNSQELTQGVLTKYLQEKGKSKPDYHHLGSSFTEALAAIDHRRRQLQLFEEKNKPAVLGLLEGKNLFSEQYLVHIRDAQGLNSLTREVVWLANHLCGPRRYATEQQLGAIKAALNQLNSQEPTQDLLAKHLGIEKNVWGLCCYPHLGGSFEAALEAIDQRCPQVKLFEGKIKPAVLSLLKESFNELVLYPIQEAQSLHSLTSEIVKLADRLCNPIGYATEQQLGVIADVLRLLNEDSTQSVLPQHLGIRDGWGLFYPHLEGSVTKALAAIGAKKASLKIRGDR